MHDVVILTAHTHTINHHIVILPFRWSRTGSKHDILGCLNNTHFMNSWRNQQNKKVSMIYSDYIHSGKWHNMEKPTQTVLQCEEKPNWLDYITSLVIKWSENTWKNWEITFMSTQIGTKARHYGLSPNYQRFFCEKYQHFNIISESKLIWRLSVCAANHIQPQKHMKTKTTWKSTV